MNNFFRTRREELRKSQFRMAIELGVTTGTVSNWERGTNPPRLNKAGRIAKVYQVSEKKITDVIVEMTRATVSA